MSFDSIAQELQQSGISVVKNFIDPELATELRKDIGLLQSQLLFQTAAVGKGAQHQVLESVRNNELHWLERENANSTQKKIWLLLDELQQIFNRTLFLGLAAVEAHYTVYPPGGYYERHLDAFTADQKRIVSFILYLNENWEFAHGGMLRIYQDKSQLDVEPRSGTLVCFLSRELEHEVLLNQKPRLSLTGWFKTSE